MDDAELVRQVLQGNMGAFAELVRRHAARIAAVCRARVVHREDVEDLVQETFFRALDRLADLREPECFAAWLCGIARRLCLDHFHDDRRHRRHVPLDPDLAAPEPPTRDDRVAQLRQCIGRLPENEREVVALYYSGGGLTYQQIADMLGVSFAQVNRLLTTARRRLRVCLERND
jgi:RNA polymerase sigma-70 factor (ECF subfamily)